METQTKYQIKVQAIRSGKQQSRLYVYFPLPLAAAIGLNARDQLQWELLDRCELHLLLINAPRPLRLEKRATKIAAK